MTVLSVPDAKAHLQLTQPVENTLIQSYIDSAVAAIGELVGPLEPTAVTDRVRTANAGVLIVTTTPAISVTSITPIDGPALSLTGIDIDPAGVITADGAAPFTDRAYDVVYQAGRATCPADLVMAVKELVRAQWTTSVNGGRGPAAQRSERAANTVKGAEGTMPFEVSRLLAPHLLATGFA